MQPPTFPTSPPEAARIDASRLDMRYLIDGEVRTWTGRRRVSRWCAGARRDAQRAGIGTRGSSTPRRRWRPWRRRSRLGPGPRQLADDARRRPHRGDGEVCRGDGARCARTSCGSSCGRLARRARTPRRVRPHGRLHPRHHRGPRSSTATPRASASRRASSASSPRAARHRAPHGSVQPPAQRDLHDPDPGAHHGQHRRVEAAQLRHAPQSAAPRLREPSRPASSTSSRAKARRSSARSWRRATSTASPSSARAASANCSSAAPAAQPPALHHRPRGQEPGGGAARRRPRRAVRERVAGALNFNGQRCTAIKLVFVHRSPTAT